MNDINNGIMLELVINNKHETYKLQTRYCYENKVPVLFLFQSRVLEWNTFSKAKYERTTLETE